MRQNEPDERLDDFYKEFNNYPEHFELSETEFQERLKAAKLQMSSHTWRQQGIEIFCDSCPFRHGFFVGVEESLVDVKDGKPIIKKRRT